ncbi:GNAT family N-acetyltransferase [Sphingomonas sp. CGMCC 1.13654]|uniref:GNAT family N-acetyltransferase n=1 Tax=Sphingomonas chungangi TaxID=2683589 RepID=A0A838LDR6_9SPHN|nr:GNAT family N-acetyltransferase [Sphingomonas chungangi]MBA2935638.1 GNAT family N-acetyltransferase [Sphingomonas chungangi]MVW54329.1 GNAT family N-acetyltransferase [Sphingomonas chungangi]
MIETERLILRRWRDEDHAPFAAMGRWPAVMEHLGELQTDEDAAAGIARQRGFQASHGHCFWAIERKQDGAFLGFCGLKPGTVGPIDGEVEIGWRLREDAWGQGYAREAAEASIAWGWANLDTPKILAITTPANTASWGLMIRLGMTRRPDLDFGHPQFRPGDRLYEHITYEIVRP